MVTNTEANSYVSSVEWAEEGVQLKDFARKYKLPSVGRVIKGHYEGIGVPSLSCPSSRQTAFWLNGGQVIKVAAQCVKFKESRGYHGSIASRPVPFGPRLAIPDNYDGFFEILSEEGRSVRCIESVNELVKRSPSSVLIRESIKVYLPKGDNENVVSDKSRSLAIGEVNKSFSSSPIDPLSTAPTTSSPCDNQVNTNSDSSVSTSESTSSSESSSSSPSPISSTCSSTTESSSFGVKLSSPASPTHCQPGTIITTTSSSSQTKYIKGYTGKGDIVYLPIEGKGRFSPIAKEDSISGVHRISSLLTKRLPLMVRLVFGRPPAGFKSFTPEMRLFSIFSEDYLMALPVTKESAPVVTVPVSASLKIVVPKNGSSLSNHRYHDILISRFNEKTSGSPNSLLPNRIQVCEGSSLGKRLKSNWKESNIPLSGELNSDAAVTSESVNYSHKKRLFQSDSLDFVNNNINNTSSNESDNVKNVDSDLTEINGGLMGIDDEPNNTSNGKTNESDDLNVEEEDAEDNDGSCYDEIDQIYDYVRGFAPLPEKLRPSRTSNSDSPPEPPPIETIPSLVTHQHHHGNPHHPSYPSHHHSSYRRLSYPTVFHEILPKMGLYEKKVSPSEHIYEKVPLSSGHHRPEKRYHSGNIRSRENSYHHQQSSSSHNHHGPRIPMRSNSTGKMYLPLNGLPVHPHPGHLSSSNHHSSTQLHQLHPLHQQHNNLHHAPLAKPKLFIKSNHQPSAGPFTNGSNGNSNNNRKTNKLMRNARGLSLTNENSAPYYNNNNENDKDLIFNNNNINNNYHGIKVNTNDINKWTCRSSRSLTTSPLFNIRYKSLTNLHFINPLANSSSSKGCYDHHSNNTLASSNSSGCKISSGSGRSVESPSDTKAKKTRKLSRPLSFSNLFWDLKNDLISSSAHHNNNNTIESIYPDPRISSSPNGGEPSAMVLTQLVNNVASNRRVGTLYL
uniref:CABIT domain-containing protein n=1 Tax=Tetranychus urticae TaxID=32264 RepID=T1KSA8_TETUR